MKNSIIPSKKPKSWKPICILPTGCNLMEVFIPTGTWANQATKTQAIFISIKSWILITIFQHFILNLALIFSRKLPANCFSLTIFRGKASQYVLSLVFFAEWPRSMFWSCYFSRNLPATCFGLIIFRGMASQHVLVLLFFAVSALQIINGWGSWFLK